MKLLLGVDTETTGVTPEDKVLQIAAILVDPVSFETLDTLCLLVDPQREIHPGAQKVHGISPEMVAGQPTIEDVWRESTLIDWIQKADGLFGHNVRFDRRMLNNPELDSLPLIDTLDISRIQFPELRNHKLQTLVNDLGLPSRKAHDALGDIESSADVLRYLSRNHGLKVEDFLTLTGAVKSRFLGNLSRLGLV